MTTPQDPVREWAESLNYRCSWGCYYIHDQYGTVAPDVMKFFYQQMLAAQQQEADPNVSGIKIPRQRNHVNNTDYDKGWNACWDAYWTARWERVGEITALTQQSKLDGGK